MISKLRERFIHIINTEILKKPYPINLTLFITERCNLNCAHCFVWNKARKPRKEMTGTEMLTFLKNAEKKIKSLNITGGEPLISENFQKVFEYASNMKGMKRIGIYTNGIEYKKLLDILKKYANKSVRYSIQTSLDGPEEIHNAIRGSDNAYESVINLISCINNLKSEINISIEIVMTVSKANYSYINEVINIAKKHNVQFAINFVRSSEQAVLPNDERSDFVTVNNSDDLSIEQVREAVKLWLNTTGLCIEDEIFVLHKIRMENIIFFLTNNKWKYPCGAGINDAIVYPDGSISICEMKSPIGNIADYDFNYEYFWKMHKIKELHECYCLFDCAISYSILQSWSGRKLLFCELLRKFSAKLTST